MFVCLDIDYTYIPSEYLALVKLPLSKEETNLNILKTGNNTGNILTFIIPRNASSPQNILAEVSTTCLYYIYFACASLFFTDVYVMLRFRVWNVCL